MRTRGTARVLLALLTLLVTLLGLPALAGPAAAGRYVHHDRAADVVQVSSPAGDCSPCQQVDRPDADLLRFSADYGRTLRVSLTLGALPRHGSAGWLVRTGPHRWLTVFVRLERVRVTCSTLRSGEPDSEAIACRRIDLLVDHDRSRLSAALPASLFGAPRSVKVGAGSFAETADGAAAYLDDGLRRRFDPYRPGLYLTAGRSIHRG